MAKISSLAPKDLLGGFFYSSLLHETTHVVDTKPVVNKYNGKKEEQNVINVSHILWATSIFRIGSIRL